MTYRLEAEDFFLMISIGVRAVRNAKKSVPLSVFEWRRRLRLSTQKLGFPFLISISHGVFSVVCA
jgi:hypothetical protein